MVNLSNKPDDKWDWLPKDENDNPIFSDLDDIIFFEWMKDRLTWEPPSRPGYSDMDGPPRWFWPAAMLGLAIMLILAYFMW